MQTKIVSLKETKKPHNLSPLMIAALVDAFVNQQHGIPFGPADIKGGSLTPLINRGLVVFKTAPMENKNQSEWQLTPDAIAILREMGVKVTNDLQN